MQRKLLCYGLLALAAGAMLWACRKDWRSGDDLPEDVLTAEQARAFFENSAALTKAGSGYLSAEHGIGRDLSPGDITPLWDRARSAALNGYVDGVDVEIDPTNRYAAVFRTISATGAVTERTVEITQKLAVNRWRNHPRWLGLYAYIATIIPTPEYYATHKNIGRTFVNLGDKKGFSGFVIYHTLAGEFVNADRYEKGRLTAQVYDTGGPAADAAAAARMLNGVELMGGTTMHRTTIETEEVIVTACKECKMQGCKCKMNGALPCQCIPPPKPPDPPVPPVPPVPPGGGGGVGPIIGPLPPIVDEDCSGTASQNTSNAKSMLDIFNQNGLQDFINRHIGDGKEWGASLNYNTGNQKYSLANEIPGESGHVMQKYNYDNTYYTTALVHTHPNSGQPHSVADAIALVDAYLGTGHQTTTSFVAINTGGEPIIYALQMEDQTGAKFFHTNSKEASFVTQLNNELNSAFQAIYGQDHSSLDESYAYALSLVLKKYNAGISVLKFEKGSFKQKSATQTDNTINRTSCK